MFPLREAYRLTAMLTGVTEAPVVTVLPDAGHFPHESHPEAFNRALLRFLQP